MTTTPATKPVPANPPDFEGMEAFFKRIGDEHKALAELRASRIALAEAAREFLAALDATDCMQRIEANVLTPEKRQFHLDTYGETWWWRWADKEAVKLDRLKTAARNLRQALGDA